MTDPKLDRARAATPRRLCGARVRIGLVVALLGTSGALAMYGCGSSGSDSGSEQTEAAKSTTTLADASASEVPTDQPRHVYVKGAKAVAARQAAIAKAKAKAAAKKAAAKKAAAKKAAAQAPKPTKAQLEPGPGGIPPASVGTNGSFKPHSPGELSRIHAKSANSIAGTDPDHSAILVGRTALAPSGAPPQVKRAIGSANAIVGTPYIWGGGHGSWNDRGYDCSGSVSYALGGAGLLGAPLASSGLEHWGAPGPGKWITVYANAGHTYAVIAGLRWDTVGDLRGSGPRWHAELPYPKGFVVRHPPGL